MTTVAPQAVVAGRVGSNRGAVGTNVSFRQGFDSELVVNLLHGKHYQQAYDGNLFYAYAAGVALSAPGTAITGLILWNSSANKNLILNKVNLEVSVTSASLTGLALATTTPGAQTTTPTSTTPITKQGAGLLGAAAGVGIAYNAATLLTTLAFWPLAHNTAAIATTGIDSIERDLDGMFIVPPFTAVHIAALGAASAAAALTAGVTWEESPI